MHTVLTGWMWGHAWEKETWGGAQIIGTQRHGDGRGKPTHTQRDSDMRGWGEGTWRHKEIMGEFDHASCAACTGRAGWCVVS